MSAGSEESLPPIAQEQVCMAANDAESRLVNLQWHASWIAAQIGSRRSFCVARFNFAGFCI